MNWQRRANFKKRPRRKPWRPTKGRPSRPRRRFVPGAFGRSNIEEYALFIEITPNQLRVSRLKKRQVRDFFKWKLRNFRLTQSGKHAVSYHRRKVQKHVLEAERKALAAWNVFPIDID